MPKLTPDPRTLDAAAFVARFGGVYEHSPWIAEAVFAAGLPEAAAEPGVLAAAMAGIVDAAGTARQLALLRAHPDLAGRLAMAGGLSDSSKAEQAGSGLDRCSAEEFSAFTALNATYTARYGFPFILAVRGRTRAEILASFQARVGVDPVTEFATALGEVHRIARLRLDAMASD